MDGQGTTRSRWAALLFVAAVVAVALNQRPAVVAVAPLLGDLRADTGLSPAMAGLLTTLPVLCVGSLLAGAAIAVANVLMPAYVKREAARPGLVMGLYSASLNVGAAASAAGTVPFAAAVGWGWRGGLAGWLVLALAALALWLPAAGTGRAQRVARGAVPDGGSWALLRQPLARRVTLFIGLQSVQFYSIGAWLPTLLADAGVPVSEGGLLLGLSNVVGAVGALLAPAQA